MSTGGGFSQECLFATKINQTIQPPMTIDLMNQSDLASQLKRPLYQQCRGRSFENARTISFLLHKKARRNKE
jgi:hypothetical protein